MNEKEWKEMDDVFKEIEVQDIQIPEEFYHRIEGRVNKMRKKHQKLKISRWAVGTVAACTASLMITVNVSPSFAASISQVPVLAEMVDLFRWDKGIQTAMEQGHIQPIDHSSSDAGLTFQIDNLVADRKRMVITYSVHSEAKGPLESIQFLDFLITDDKGNVYATHVNPISEVNGVKYLTRNIQEPTKMKNDETKKMKGYMEIVSLGEELILPSVISMNITHFKESDYYAEKFKRSPVEFRGKWSVGFELDSKLLKEKPQVIPGKEFVIQTEEHPLKIKVENTTVYPTMTQLQIKLLNPDVLKGKGIAYTYHLEDERGRKYQHLDDGVLTDTGNTQPEFESTYFNNPSELYLVFDSIRINNSNGPVKAIPIDTKVQLY